MGSLSAPWRQGRRLASVCVVRPWSLDPGSATVPQFGLAEAGIEPQPDHRGVRLPGSQPYESPDMPRRRADGRHVNVVDGEVSAMGKGREPPTVAYGTATPKAPGRYLRLRSRHKLICERRPGKVRIDAIAILPCVHPDAGSARPNPLLPHRRP